MAWGLIALAVAGGMALLAYELTRTRLVEEREEAARTQTYVDARLLRNALRAADPDVSAVLSSFEGNARTTVFARVGGEWFAGSVGIAPDALPGSLTEAVADGHAAHVLTRIDDVPYVAVGVPIVGFDTLYFEVVPMEDLARTLDDLARGMLAGAAVATLTAALAGWYASGRVLLPLREFAAAAETIAEGDLGARLDTRGDPDLRALQRSFNRMADAVQERIDREARFTSDVSHELRSPIAAMLSALHVARRRAHDPASADEALDTLEERLDGLHRLVEDLLEISRVEAGVAELQLEPVDPGRLAAAALEGMGAGGIVPRVAPQVPPVALLDKRRVGQMLQNLIENAQRYAGGVTAVEVFTDGDKLCFAVEDEGPGVPVHERSYIFERFARGDDAKGTAGGTGLGLALVAEHASLHGGSARVDDGGRGGARFVISLPCRVPA